MFAPANLPRAILPAARSWRYASQLTNVSSALRPAAFTTSTRAQKSTEPRALEWREAIARAHNPADEESSTLGQQEETRPQRGGKWQAGSAQEKLAQLIGGAPPQDEDPWTRPEYAMKMPEKNYHGDIVLFEGQKPDPGYSFFLRNRFLMRHCRGISRQRNQKTYIYIPKIKAEQGYYVRTEILEEVRSRTEELNASDRRRFFQNLVEHYPLMPEEDRAEVDKLVYSTFLARTAKSPQFYYNHTVRLYVLDKYTDVKFRAPFAVDEAAIGNSHILADKILCAWRGGSTYYTYAENPVADGSGAYEPGADEPGVADKPVFAPKPVPDDPFADDPVVANPFGDEPVVADKPVADEPVAKE